MAVLTDAQRARIAANAASALREDQLSWESGAWFRNPESTDDTCGSGEKLGKIREWLRERNFLGPRNLRRKCGVCAEGALLWAIALDESIPDDAYGAALLDEFDDDAAEALARKGFLETSSDFESIPDWNDVGSRTENDVILFLEELSD